MTEPPICYNCKHQSERDPFKCDAFPGGIPAAIIENAADHRQPIEGDRGIRYDPIDPDIPLPTIGGETDEGVLY
jgi:hypothetical protein